MKRKKEKSGNFLDKLLFLLWYVYFGFIIVICLLVILNKKGYCASSTNYNLPYYVDYYKSAYFTTFNTEQLNSVLPSGYDLYWISEPDTQYNDLVFYLYAVAYNDTFVLKNHDLNANVDYNIFDFTTDYVVFTGNVYCRRFFINSSGVNSWGNGFTTSNVAILGRSSSSINSYGYTANVPFLCNHDFILNGDIVFTNGVPNITPPIEYGHATPPEEFNTPIYNTGHTPPQNVPPTITVNNYSWTTYTPPAIDDSGIIETIKSEIQVINYLAGWLKDNLQGMMTNLVNNIKSLFDYLVETIQYYGNLLVSNIQNLITTFYNNMVSIGEDITDKLTYIVSPLDTTALQTAIQNTGIYNDYDRIFDMVGDAFGFYNDITEPNTFTIPIDLRNVTILHQTQIVYIDLGCLNSCKTIIRAFMWCVLTFGLLYTIIDSIPDYLQGNDE